MQLTVLGGAAAWPNPGQGCSSYLISSGSTNIVVDCGSDTFLELRKHIDYHDVDCDRVITLPLRPYARPGAISLWVALRTEQTSNDASDLWLPPGGMDILSRLALRAGKAEKTWSRFGREAFDLREYDPATALAWLG